VKRLADKLRGSSCVEALGLPLPRAKLLLEGKEERAYDVRADLAAIDAVAEVASMRLRLPSQPSLPRGSLLWGAEVGHVGQPIPPSFAGSVGDRIVAQPVFFRRGFRVWCDILSANIVDSLSKSLPLRSVGALIYGRG
jgi:hypothetical protein